MNVPTCFRCPKRFTEVPTQDGRQKRVRCEKLTARLASVKSLSLSSISFKCEIRDALLSPGDVVAFGLFFRDNEDGNGGSVSDCSGIVMRTKPRKVLVYCEGSEKNPIWIRDDAKKTGESVPVCRHCRKPIGKELKINGQEWVCRTEFEPGEFGGESQPMECEI